MNAKEPKFDLLLGFPEGLVSSSIILNMDLNELFFFTKLSHVCLILEESRILKHQKTWGNQNTYFFFVFFSLPLP